MSSESDLTDFEDDDDIDIPLSQRKNSKLPKDFEIRGALAAPRNVSYTTQSLYDMMYAQDIDLNAEYQRDVVWQEHKQSGLIDSILRNYYIPPVIFVVKYNDDGSESRVCIDGKQRLTSIYRFMDGQIPYKDPLSNAKYVYKDAGLLKARELPENYQKIFRIKQIACVEYSKLTEENEREIFQRVQLGMALTPAEKLQAVSSPAAAFIRELQTRYVADGLARDLDWDTSRASDFRGLASAVQAISKWPSLATIPSLTQVQNWLSQSDEVNANFREKVHQTFQIFAMLARDSKYNRAFRLPNIKKVSPVEFIAICLMIYAHMQKLTLAQLSEAIEMMRMDIRQVETDIRMNSRVMKPMLVFIKKLKLSQLKPDPNQPVATQAVSAKRKRKDDSDEEAESMDKKKPNLKLQTTTSSSIPSPAVPSPNPPIVGRPVPSASIKIKDDPMSPSLPPSTPSTAVTASASTVAFSFPATDRLAAIKAAKLNRALSSNSPSPAPPPNTRNQSQLQSPPGPSSAPSHSSPHIVPNAGASSSSTMMASAYPNAPRSTALAPPVAEGLMARIMAPPIASSIANGTTIPIARPPSQPDSRPSTPHSPALPLGQPPSQQAPAQIRTPAPAPPSFPRSMSQGHNYPAYGSTPTEPRYPSPGDRRSFSGPNSGPQEQGWSGRREYSGPGHGYNSSSSGYNDGRGGGYRR